MKAAGAPVVGDRSSAPDAQSLEQGTAAAAPEATEPHGTMQDHAHNGLMQPADDVREPASLPLVAEGAPPFELEAADEPIQPGVTSTVLSQSSFQRNRYLSFVGASAVLRQGDDDLAMPFVSEAEAAAYGRSSIDSYALASCSSEALTTDLLISDDEDAGARPRSGWPLMLRSRYGTPGQRESGSDAGPWRHSDESTADGSPRMAALALGVVMPLPASVNQLQPVAVSVGAADAPHQLEQGAVLATEPATTALHEQPPSFGDQLNQLQPVAVSVGAADAPHQLEQGAVLATEPATTALHEQPPSAGDRLLQSLPAPEAAVEEECMPTQAEASATGAPAQPSQITLIASPAAEGPAAAEPGDHTAAGGHAEDEGPEWHVPGPSSNLPEAAIAARYSHSLTSPAAVSLPCPLTLQLIPTVSFAASHVPSSMQMRRKCDIFSLSALMGKHRSQTCIIMPLPMQGATFRASAAHHKAVGFAHITFGDTQVAGPAAAASILRSTGGGQSDAGGAIQLSTAEQSPPAADTMTQADDSPAQPGDEQPGSAGSAVTKRGMLDVSPAVDVTTTDAGATDGKQQLGLSQSLPPSAAQDASMVPDSSSFAPLAAPGHEAVITADVEPLTADSQPPAMGAAAEAASAGYRSTERPTGLTEPGAPLAATSGTAEQHAVESVTAAGPSTGVFAADVTGQQTVPSDEAIMLSTDAAAADGDDRAAQV